MSYDDAKYTLGVKLIAEQIVEMLIEDDSSDANDEEDFIATATSDIKDAISNIANRRKK